MARLQPDAAAPLLTAAAAAAAPLPTLPRPPPPTSRTTTQDLPSPAQMEQIAARWAPYRSLGSYYM